METGIRLSPHISPLDPPDNHQQRIPEHQEKLPHFIVTSGFRRLHAPIVPQRARSVNCQNLQDPPAQPSLWNPIVDEARHIAGMNNLGDDMNAAGRLRNADVFL